MDRRSNNNDYTSLSSFRSTRLDHNSYMGFTQSQTNPKSMLYILHNCFANIKSDVSLVRCTMKSPQAKLFPWTDRELLLEGLILLFEN